MYNCVQLTLGWSLKAIYANFLWSDVGNTVRSDHAYHANHVHKCKQARPQNDSHFSNARVQARNTALPSVGGPSMYPRTARTIARTRLPTQHRPFVPYAIRALVPIEQLGTKSTHQQAHAARHKGIGFKATAPTAVHGSETVVGRRTRLHNGTHARSHVLSDIRLHTVCFPSHCNITVCCIQCVAKCCALFPSCV